MAEGTSVKALLPEGELDGWQNQALLRGAQQQGKSNDHNKKEAYRKWKQERATKEEYRNITWAWKDRMRKVKAWLESKLMRDLECNHKGFNTFVSNIRKTRENVGLLLSGGLCLQDMDKAEMFNTFFALGFTGPDRTHWRLLRELTSVIMKLLSVITERLWWLEEVPDAWRKANVSAVIRKGKSEELRAHEPHTSLQESDGAGSHGSLEEGVGKSKSKVPALGWDNPMHQYRLGV
ncbi:hypothetical protein QYF61_013743 [Mycteria americana]|uniref:Uncharacterized protein n=1 Tax=Mycteria americana TaxID=33587 RepID=A0AAN7NUQ1_MYCAM|nr:hypothetical protein QYF61_013743 [Mycteria americana]